jgi:plastocyanin
VRRTRSRARTDWRLAAALVLAAAATAGRAEDPVNGCTLRQAVDWTEVGPNPRHVDFACCAYTPPCVRIRPGRTVRWLGDFTMHPLRPGLFVGGSPQPQPGNPIPAVDSGTSSGQVSFPQPGAWGFYCNFHGASNAMYGTVYVALFADGFESHDLSAWSLAVPAREPLRKPAE